MSGNIPYRIRAIEDALEAMQIEIRNLRDERDHRIIQEPSLLWRGVRTCLLTLGGAVATLGGMVTAFAGSEVVHNLVWAVGSSVVCAVLEMMKDSPNYPEWLRNISRNLQDRFKESMKSK
jgi:hypothetical protein